METFSALLAICAGNSPVSGEFPAQRSVTRSFDVFFDLRLNKQLNKQSWGWWFERLSRSLWRHCNALAPGKFEWSFRYVIFKRILMIDGWGNSCEIALIWMSLDFTDDQSTLFQVMAGAVRQQAITWDNVDPDLCRHMVSLGHNELRMSSYPYRNSRYEDKTVSGPSYLYDGNTQTWKDRPYLETGPRYPFHCIYTTGFH